MDRLTKKEMLWGVYDVVHSRKLCYNTVKYTTSDGREIIRYCYTDIVSFSPDKETITLNTNGWWGSPTTRHRINGYQDKVRIYTEKGMCYIIPRHSTNEIKERSIFYDGVQIKNGKIVNPLKEDKKTVITNLINRYCRRMRWNFKEMPTISTVDNNKDLLYMVENQLVNTDVIIKALKEAKYTERIYEVRAITPIVNSLRRYLKKRLT